MDGHSGADIGGQWALGGAERAPEPQGGADCGADCGGGWTQFSEPVGTEGYTEIAYFKPLGSSGHWLFYCQPTLEIGRLAIRIPTATGMVWPHLTETDHGYITETRSLPEILDGPGCPWLVIEQGTRQGSYPDTLGYIYLKEAIFPPALSSLRRQNRPPLLDEQLQRHLLRRAFAAPPHHLGHEGLFGRGPALHHVARIRELLDGALMLAGVTPCLATCDGTDAVWA